jgi:hypothetical protein
MPETVKFKVGHSIVEPLPPETFIEKINKTPKKKYAPGEGKNVHGG